jgi:hypothetical protein
VGGVVTRALAFNARRTGLFIQNKDAAAVCYFNFNIAADVNSADLPPGGVLLLDFTTVPGELYLFSPANIQVVVIEISRAGHS